MSLANFKKFLLNIKNMRYYGSRIKNKNSEERKKKKYVPKEDEDNLTNEDIQSAINDFLLHQLPDEELIKSPIEEKKQAKLKEMTKKIEKILIEQLDITQKEAHKLKIDALNSLPEVLRKEAEKTDWNPFPIRYIG
jgi:hypothetical protein